VRLVVVACTVDGRGSKSLADTFDYTTSVSPIRKPHNAALYSV
jgi:hypothetical protein